MSSPRKVFIVGVGHTKFRYASDPDTPDYPELGAEAIRGAVEDAGIDFAKIEQCVGSFVYADSTAAQACVYRVAKTGVPIINVNNNCSSGSTALFTARQFVAGGSSCVLAFGFEKMEMGLQALFPNMEHPANSHFEAMWKCGIPKKRFLEGMMTELTENVLKVYAHNATQHMKRFGVTIDQICKVASKNHWHSQYSPYAPNTKPLTVDQVKESRALFPPLTMGMAAGMGSGAAAVILCDESFVRANNLHDNAVEILGMAMTSDTNETFSPTQTPDPSRNLCGYDLSARAAERAYKEAGVKPSEVDILEIHDAFASNELCTYSALQLCKEGGEGALIDGAELVENSNGGQVYKINNKHFINLSGGLESKLHPTGCTGVAQCVELNLQLRNLGGKRQAPVREAIALQHNYGWSSCAVVSIYKKANLVGGKSKI